MAFSGFQDFTPEFGGSLQRFLAASPGITVGSGYRDIARQQFLWNRALAKYGSPEAARHWVAPPGKSRHNMRLAADLQFRNDAARQWAHAQAANYGLTFPMGHEPWHIEMAGARGDGGDTSPPSGVSIDVANSQSLLPDTFAAAVDSSGGNPLSGMAENASRRLAGGDTRGQPQITETPRDMSVPTLDFQRASLPADVFSKRKQALSPQPSDLSDLFDLKTIGGAGLVSPVV